MRAIQKLIEEHQALRRVLDALELVLDCQRDCDRLDADLALEAIEWLERFGDGLHQDREELGLFPRLVLRAPQQAKPMLEALMRWHAEERERLEEMRARIEGAAYGDPLSRDAFTVAARSYIDIQRGHSEIEDRRLLPLAAEVLTPADDQAIAAEYERLEVQYLGREVSRPLERARDLAVRALGRALDRESDRLLPSLANGPAQTDQSELHPVG